MFVISLFLCLILTEARDLPHSYHFEASNKSFVADYMKLPATARSMSPTFETDSPDEKFTSNSQGKQDVAILTLLGDIEGGYFVDLAANAWKYWSNSYTLETFNKWKGICIEPNPMYLEGLVSNRKCKIFTCAVGASDNEKVTFRFSKGEDGVFGGVVGEEFDNTGTDKEDKEVQSVSLTTLLDFAEAPRVMQYLSLDVEGAEYHVIKGLDHSKYIFQVITIERPKANTHHLLSRAGYRFMKQMTGFGECIYMHRSAPRYDALMTQYYKRSGLGWAGNMQVNYLLHPGWDQEHVKEHGEHGVNEKERVEKE